VEFHQVTHDRQPQAEAAVLPADRSIRLSEAVEHMRQKSAVDTGAIVFDRNAQGAMFGLDELDLDHASRLRELDGVGEQVPDHLLEPGRVACGRMGIE